MFEVSQLEELLKIALIETSQKSMRGNIISEIGQMSRI